MNHMYQPLFGERKHELNDSPEILNQMKEVGDKIKKKVLEIPKPHLPVNKAQLEGFVQNNKQLLTTLLIIIIILVLLYLVYHQKKQSGFIRTLKKKMKRLG